MNFVPAFFPRGVAPPHTRPLRSSRATNIMDQKSTSGSVSLALMSTEYYGDHDHDHYGEDDDDDDDDGDGGDDADGDVRVSKTDGHADEYPRNIF